MKKENEEKGRMTMTPYYNLPFSQNGDLSAPMWYVKFRMAIRNGRVIQPLYVLLTGSLVQFLADHTNGHAIGTVLCLSVVVVCDVCIVAKRCVLE